MPEQNLRFACTAHHEAGHIAVAAAQGLEVRPEGFAMDIQNIGENDDSEAQHPRTNPSEMILTFAYAQQRFTSFIPVAFVESR